MPAQDSPESEGSSGDAAGYRGGGAGRTDFLNLESIVIAYIVQEKGLGGGTRKSVWRTILWVGDGHTDAGRNLKVYVQGRQAGTDILDTVNATAANVAPVSTLILVSTSLSTAGWCVSVFGIIGLLGAALLNRKNVEATAEFGLENLSR